MQIYEIKEAMPKRIREVPHIADRTFIDNLVSETSKPSEGLKKFRSFLKLT